MQYLKNENPPILIAIVHDTTGAEPAWQAL